MRFQFKACECGHNKKISVKVAHGLFEKSNLKRFTWIGFKQIWSRHCLVEIGCSLRHDRWICVIKHGLGAAGVIGMHGMTKLMCKRAHTADAVCVAHQNKRMRVL